MGERQNRVTITAGRGWRWYETVAVGFALGLVLGALTLAYAWAGTR